MKLNILILASLKSELYFKIVLILIIRKILKIEADDWSEWKAFDLYYTVCIAHVNIAISFHSYICCQKIEFNIRSIFNVRYFCFY